MSVNRKKVAIILAIIVVSLATMALVIRFCMRGPFVYAGTLETTKVILTSRVASDVSAVYVEEGDAVTANQSVMDLSCDVYKVVATQINGDYERAVTLRAKGHMSQAEFDVVVRNKQDSDLKLSWCNIKSPIDGMIITKFREMGEVVAPGTVLISVANPYDIWAYFYVPYEMLHMLRVGQSVIGTLPEAPGKQFLGKIVKINEEAEFTPKNVQTSEERMRLVYGIKVKFDNPDLVLKSGMTIESSLINE